jgi:uncharacterized protein with von Willebrand factor type A (vWA) domain
MTTAPPPSIALDSLGSASRRRLAGFVRSLRDNGFAVGLAETKDAVTILTSPEAARPASLQMAFRALFCAGHADWQKFAEIFQAYWLGQGMRRKQMSSRSSAGGPKAERRPMPGGLGSEDLGPGDHVDRRTATSDDRPVEGHGRQGGASRAENLAVTDLRHVTDPDDLAAVHAMTTRLSQILRAKLIRRHQARRKGQRLDLRRTIHRSVAHGGTPVDLVWRKRKSRPLRLVVLLDASGSMSLYTAFFLRFIHTVLDVFERAEAYIFHTRLSHVSAAIRDRSVERAIERLALEAEGIGGGTRIGDCLADFNHWHAPRVIDSRTAVIIVSDGYDTGEPEHLGREMRQLHRRCRRIIWLNPLIGWDGYTPEARGMQAALPYVALFAAAHNVESLAALAPYLARI